MKETYYFPHDYNARGDRKLVKVIMEHGMEGIGVFWCLVEMLYEEGGYMPLEYDRIRFELRTEIQIVQSIINEFDLFENDGSKFWSNSVLSRLQERAEKSEKARKSIQSRWEGYERDTNVLRANNKRISIKGKKRKEIKEIKEIKGEKEDFPFGTFWNLYDKKVDREKCEDLWKKLSDSERQSCMNKIPAYKISTPDKKFRRNPETYLKNKGWENELIIQNGNNKSDDQGKIGRVNELWNQQI